jgi:excisionase family DNA binding protein
MKKKSQVALPDTTGPTREPLPTTYTTDEVAAHFGISRGAVVTAINAGKLKAGMIGGRFRVTPAAVRAWAEQDQSVVE